MKILPLKLRKNGFDYSQVLRGRRSCIYRQAVTPEINYFEVFIIISKPKRDIFGKTIPAKEVFPCNENFGDTAWSCRTYNRAKQRFDELESA